MTIDDLKLELIALQKKDTINALNKGFKNKSEWFKYVINEKEDEVASAILDIAKRYSIKDDIVAYHFDPTMVLRITKVKKDKEITI